MMQGVDAATIPRGTRRPDRPRAVSLVAVATLLVAASTGCSRLPAPERRATSVAPGAQAVAVVDGAPGSSISGLVEDDEGPVADAVVRVQTTAHETRTDSAGRFTLTGIASPLPVAITAFSPGYFIGGGMKHAPGATDVRIELERHASVDNRSYEWVSASADGGDEGNCENCHSQAQDPTSTLPFDEWRRDAHGGSSANIRFLTLYTGEDVDGNLSPFARFGDSRRFSGTDPLVPDPGQPYYGPGFALDYPYTGGSCASCHVPAGRFDSTFGVDPTSVTGAAAEGVTCDLCHKIWDVLLEEDTGLPNRDAPGVLSYEFRRPPAGHQFFAGPLDDVAPGEDTFTPIQKESEYCAGCHYGVFWDTTVYNSFGEWKESPYSDPETGRTCQNCHMPSVGATHFAAPGKGGLARDPAQVSSHKMLGITDEAFMRDALAVDVTASRDGPAIVVEVAIANDNTGHHVPTDSPLRHLILLVSAVSDSGQALAQRDGPTVPDWGGVGDVAEGYYAGLPGSAYAKILQEFRSGLAPTAAYWNPTRVLSDNRIPALATDITWYVFDAPQTGAATVEVTLLFRRAFIDLAVLKGWSDADLVLHRETIVVQGEG